MTFSMSFSVVLRRTMDWKDFSVLYDSLLGLGIMTVVAVLKCNGQNSRLMHVLAIHTIFLRQMLSMISSFRCLHEM